MSRVSEIVMVFVLAVGLLGAPAAFAQASKDTLAEKVIRQATYSGIKGQVIAKQPAEKR